MRSVAIIGFSELTLPYLKDSKADEYWTMNHVVLIDYVKMPRIDRLFEIHKREWYLRGEQTKSRNYNKWLKKKHPFPIYMQEEELNTGLVPSAVKYPFQEICDDLLPGLIKVIGVEETHLTYFTSTASFMFALAIHEKFDQIELYGVDMDSDTEWGYQKPCGEFWLGLALGRGIKVILPETSNLCSAPIYGYEIVPYIDKLNVKAIIEAYQEKHKVLRDEMLLAGVEVEKDPDNFDATDHYLSASSWVYLYEGAIMAGGRLMQIKDSYISRQQIEIKRADYLRNMEENKAFVNTAKGQIDLAGRENVPDNVWRSYLTARANMFANLGAMQLHKKLMRIIDFRNVKMELAMEVIED